MTVTFREHMTGIVTDFLETALVVDDEGFVRETARARVREADEEPIVVPSREDLTLAEPSERELLAVEEQHPLDTKVLIDAFADLGVVCSVLAPLEGDQIRERVLRAAKRSDLLVLDWQLHRDGGTTARQLIKSVLDQDGSGERRRLRVIAIYTGEPGLKGIIEKIRKHLKWPPGAVGGERVTLVRENVRIVAFEKPLRTRRQPEPGAKQIQEKGLPAQLVAEFVHLSDGLVPGVALAALSSIRSDTHRILQALREDMDLGYLGHRVASPFPEEAEGHLVEIVAAEIASVLSDAQLGSHANMGVIREWLNQAREAPEALDYGSALATPRSIDDQQIVKMLTVGLGLDEKLEQHTSEGLKKGALKQLRKQAAHLFTNDADQATASADIFGMRMAVRTIYRRPHRVLRLGTIVLRKDEFMVCLQPVCDSVRMVADEPRGFPFLPLKVTELQEARHEFVVQHPEEGRLVRLQLETKPFALKTMRFECDDSRSVQAKLVRRKWAFYNTSGRRFLWVADLKPEFAQRVAVDLAAELARVGLSESELVRLSAD